MRTLIYRPLMVLAFLLLAWCAVHAWIHHSVQPELKQAHAQEVVMFGDSHAGDVRLPDFSRFAFPALDLVSTWMWMEAFERAGGPESKVKAVVLTIWPIKFSPVAERRLTGRNQDDSWGQSVLGKSSHVLGVRHLMESELPWRLRWRMWLNTFQMRSSIHAKGWVCQDKSIAPDYKYTAGKLVREENWFDQATVSRWAFDQIVALADRNSWELVMVEHPLHPSFLDDVNPEALAQYEAAMQSAAAHPGITYLNMARTPLLHTGFRDHNHLTCEGSEVVSDRLYPLLKELGVNF